MTDRTLRYDDVEIPAALRLRLAAIEAELPRTTRWRATGPGAAHLHVVRADVHALRSAPPRRRAGLERLVAAVVALAILGGGYLLGRGTDTPGGIAIPTSSSLPVHSTPRPSVAPSAAGSEDPGDPAGPSVKPTPQSRLPGIETLRGAGDGPTLIARRYGWPCRLHRDVAAPADLAMVDKLVDTRGAKDGWIVTPAKIRLRLGGTEAEAAAAFDAVLIADGADGGPWIVIDAADGLVAYALVAERTVKGRLTWRLGDSETPTGCGDPSPKAALSKTAAAVKAGRLQVVDARIVRLEPAGALAQGPS
jgi:hypothetical protein